MPYYRDYIPTYPHTNEELEIIVKHELAKSKRHYRVMKNDAPYDTYKNQAVNVDHLTIRYNEKTSPTTLDTIRTNYNIKWYTLIENCPEDKSIDLPHFHAIRRIATFTNM